MNTEKIRERLSSLDFVSKLDIWNKFVIDRDCKQRQILFNAFTTLEILAKTVNASPYDIMWSEDYDRADDYITTDDDGNICSLTERDAKALVDVNLRVDFTDALVKGCDVAKRLYDERFGSEEEHTDSEEYKSDKNYFKCVYTYKDGKPSVEVETLDADGELIKRSYCEKDAEDAWKMVKDKMKRDDAFGMFSPVIPSFFGDFKGFFPW